MFNAPEPVLMPYAGSPMADQVPEKAIDAIMHAQIEIGTVTLMGADAVCDTPEHPDWGYARPQGMAVTINLEDPAEADRLFAALSDGGTVQMPIDETFWAQRFGMCTDRFGIPWMVNCAKSHG